MFSMLTETLLGRTFLGYLLMFAVPLILPALFVKLIGFQGLRHLFSYEPKDTAIHRVDPRLKIVYPVVIGILSVILNWFYVFLLLGVSLIPWLILRPSLARIRVTLTMAITPVIGMIWSQGMFYGYHPGVHYLFVFPWTIRWFGSVGLSIEGLYYGAEQAGRMLVPASASLILLLSTKPSDIIWAFYKFRFPPVAGFAFTVALRFLPQMIERVTLLQKAMQVRGYDLSKPRWWQLNQWAGYLRRVFGSIPTITMALLIQSLRTTSVMALVADARAFGSEKQRVTLQEYQSTSADRIGWGALAALVILVVGLVSMHIGNRQL
ncbi:MAG: ABC-type cobalt transport system, permease component CbiQ [Cohnella sp.]|jgi:energy-coupling factor transport system permease protein|nr:ABC-type cobalt transport system, permease component CbiQ [Cohnella sp.]